MKMCKFSLSTMCVAALFATSASSFAASHAVCTASQQDFENFIEYGSKDNIYTYSCYIGKLSYYWVLDNWVPAVWSPTGRHLESGDCGSTGRYMVLPRTELRTVQRDCELRFPNSSGRVFQFDFKQKVSAFNLGAEQ